MILIKKLRNYDFEYIWIMGVYYDNDNVKTKWYPHTFNE